MTTTATLTPTTIGMTAVDSLSSLFALISFSVLVGVTEVVVTVVVLTSLDSYKLH